MIPLPVLKRFAHPSIMVMAVACFFCACGTAELPIEKIKTSLKDSPTYSIILEDMKDEGNFSKQYFHKYRVVQENDSWLTDWLEVPADYYRTNEKFLGMSLASRRAGEDISAATPPGYAQVGDSRYGQWKDDRRGGSFWEFYGKYRLFSDLLGGWYRPIYRNDYDMYQRNRARNLPYYGRGNEYGTSGSIAKKSNPGFFARRMQRERLKKASFTDRVAKRVGRTRTGFRGRAGGWGK